MNKKRLLTIMAGGLGYVKHIYPVETAITGIDAVGNLEAWSSDTNLTSWTEQIAGTSTINKESTIVQEGSFSARLDVDASNSQARFYYLGSNQTGKFIKVTGYIRCSEANKFGLVAYSNEPRLKVLATQNEWTYFEMTGLCLINEAFYIGRGSAASSSLYYDNLHFYNLTPTSLFATKKYTPTGDVIAKAKLRVPAGMQGGFMVNIGDFADPLANGVLCTVDRAIDPHSTAAPITAARLVKFVAGTRTSVLNVQITYVEGAELELRKSGTSYIVYYNGTPIAAAATIDDLTVVDNTLHMQFASDSSVTFGGFVV